MAFTKLENMEPYAKRLYLATPTMHGDEMKEFYSAFEAQWMKENKPHGFDVQDIRLGGMIIRTEHCIKRLEGYVSGKIEKIEELEEATLDCYGLGEEKPYEYTDLNSFKKIYTNNILTW